VNLLAFSSLAFVAAAVILPSQWCSRGDTTVEFYLADGHHFSNAERDVIETIASDAALEARRYLPALPDKIVLQVQAGKNVIAETGETGYAEPPNIVHWTVDPARGGGVTTIARRQLRTSLFEFFHHLVRAQTVKSTSLMDEVIGDGMAIAFERDFAGGSPPWGVYPDEVVAWVDELMALPATTDATSFRDDRRRWIQFKTGTYLVDRAMRSSGQSSAQLVSRPTDEVIRLALGR
jgi:hypothetical protein